MSNVKSREANLSSFNDLANRSWDDTFEVTATEPMVYDGTNLQRPVAEALNAKITVSGGITYIAQAAPGTSQATALWRVKKVDASVAGTTTITWADGNSNFDNLATDLTSLSYS